VQRLTATITDYQSRIESVPGVESKWLKLTREFDTMNESYKELQKKTEAARAAVTLEQSESASSSRAGCSRCQCGRSARSV
jgi:hypothetical protein